VESPPANSEADVISLPHRLLAVVAHPDDEVLGCGATIAEVTARGGRVSVLILSEGATTQYPDQPELVEQKRQEAADALDALGGGELRRADLPDMRMTLLPPAELTRPIAAAIQEFHPDWVITHNEADLNSDHRAVHEATRVAARPTSEMAPTLLTMEVPSSTEYGYRAHEPNLVVPLSRRALEAKFAGLECYGSEVRPYPHGRSREAVGALATYRGYTSGCDLAEGFRVVWTRAT
jgi:N-acetylglucosamine malate deacetylase 1